MRKTSKIAISSVLSGILLFTNAAAQENQKLAQTSFKFLSIISDARGAAMAEAMTSLQIGSSALFFNPAGMSGLEQTFDVTASYNQWIFDIKHYSIGTAINLANGKYGVLGFSGQYVNYGEFIGTIVNKGTDKGYDDTGIFKLYAYAIGVGYAKAISDRFSVGGQLQWAHQDLGNSTVPIESPQTPIVDSLGNPTGRYVDSAKTATNKLTPLVFDFGTQFKTGIKSLTFGMSIRNFSKEIQYVYEQFQLPLVFTLGISMDLMDLIGKASFDQSLYLSIDASHYRDHPEQLKIGLEYTILKTVAFRGGYTTNSDERNGFSFGLGVSQLGFAFDYAYTPYGILDKVQRMTARFSF
jgi:hypothetical protein